MRTFSRMGRDAWARCHRSLPSMSSGRIAVLRLTRILPLDLYTMRLEQFIEFRLVYASRLHQLPCSFTPPSTSRLEGERSQVFGPDHSYGYAVVVQGSRRGDGIFRQSVVRWKKLHWHLVHQDVF